MKLKLNARLCEVAQGNDIEVVLEIVNRDNKESSVAVCVGLYDISIRLHL